MTPESMNLANRLRTKNMIDFLAGRHSESACIDEFLFRLASGKSMEMAVAYAMYTHHRLQIEEELSDYITVSPDKMCPYNLLDSTGQFYNLLSEHVIKRKPMWAGVPTEVIVGYEWSTSNSNEKSAAAEQER